MGTPMRAAFVFLGILIVATIGPSHAQDTPAVTVSKCVIDNRLTSNDRDPNDMQVRIDFTNNTPKTATIVTIDVFVTAGSHFMIWPGHPGTYAIPFQQTGNFAPGLTVRDNEFNFLRGDLAKGEKFGDFACAATYVEFRDGTSWRASQSDLNKAMDAFSARAKLATPSPSEAKHP
jgi:hypothetical protein